MPALLLGMKYYGKKIGSDTVILPIYQSSLLDAFVIANSMNELPFQFCIC
jgi:hypothetical protein